MRSTPLTRPDDSLRTLAESCRVAGRNELDRLHEAAGRLRDAIDYQTGTTYSATTAAEALAHGVGVCQDHAHAFVTVARLLGIPARYVSGYLVSESPDGPDEAAHAWAEGLVPDLGWVGFDVANRVCATDAYVRVSAGLDYQDAAPTRGLRRGGGSEALSVRVRVSPIG